MMQGRKVWLKFNKVLRVLDGTSKVTKSDNSSTKLNLRESEE